MPLMKPDIQKVLRASGLQKAESPSDQSLPEKLEDNGLGLDTVLEQYASLIRSTDNDSLKKNALDSVLKMHGALKEQAPSVPSITIVISDPTGGEAPRGLNPILVPRPQVHTSTEREIAN